MFPLLDAVIGGNQRGALVEVENAQRCRRRCRTNDVAALSADRACRRGQSAGPPCRSVTGRTSAWSGQRKSDAASRASGATRASRASAAASARTRKRPENEIRATSQPGGRVDRSGRAGHGTNRKPVAQALPVPGDPGRHSPEPGIVRNSYPALRALNFFIRRDLRRAALFGWITPRFATRSRVLIASTTAQVATSASPVSNCQLGLLHIGASLGAIGAVPKSLLLGNPDTLLSRLAIRQFLITSIESGNHGLRSISTPRSCARSSRRDGQSYQIVTHPKQCPTANLGR